MNSRSSLRNPLIVGGRCYFCRVSTGGRHLWGCPEGSGVVEAADTGSTREIAPSTAAPPVPAQDSGLKAAYPERILDLMLEGKPILFGVGPGVRATSIVIGFTKLMSPLDPVTGAEVDKIWAAAGTKTLPRSNNNLPQRPFRAPFHSISAEALRGFSDKTRRIYPGEVSLAHGGILFLDNIELFSQEALDIVREAFENEQVSIPTSGGWVTSEPSAFCLVAECEPQYVDNVVAACPLPWVIVSE